MPSTTTPLIYVPDWVDRGPDDLLVAWDAPGNRALMEALSTGTQLQEDHAFDVLVSTELESATGDALDQWGELVGEQRLGLSDTAYRQFIQARLLVNRSGGTINDLIEILRVAAGPVLDAFHIDNLPAGIYLVAVRSSWMSDLMSRRVARMIEDARPGGRHISAIEALQGYFGFEGDPGSEGYGIGPYSRLIH